MKETSISNDNDSVITKQEAELYDRQIRLWGMDSQKRLRSANILICGLNGLGAEIAKNLILSGIRSVTLLDDKNVSEVDSCSQFMAPTTSVGTNRAEASLKRAQALNLMVKVSTDSDKLSSKTEEFFHRFDVVILIEATTDEIVRVNNMCRLKGIKFFTGDVWGMFGYSFADLQEHNFAEDVFKHKIVSDYDEKIKTELVSSTVRRTLTFTPFESILQFDFKSSHFLKKMKRSGPAFPLLRILQTFRDRNERDPSYLKRNDDLEQILAIRDEIAFGLIPDNYFTHIFAQISPVAAIIGGELAQEVIKTVSHKESPNNNVFLFDPETGAGYIELIN